MLNETDILLAPKHCRKMYFFKIVLFSFVVFLHSFYLAAASSVNIVLPMCIRILATFMFPAKNKTS